MKKFTLTSKDNEYLTLALLMTVAASLLAYLQMPTNTHSLDITKIIPDTVTIFFLPLVFSTYICLKKLKLGLLDSSLFKTYIALPFTILIISLLCSCLIYSIEELIFDLFFLKNSSLSLLDIVVKTFKRSFFYGLIYASWSTLPIFICNFIRLKYLRSQYKEETILSS